MNIDKSIETAKSDARERQGKDIVPIPPPPPPKSRTCESSDGLTVSLSASDTEKRVIAEECGRMERRIGEMEERQEIQKMKVGSEDIEEETKTEEKEEKDINFWKIYCL